MKGFFDDLWWLLLIRGIALLLLGIAAIVWPGLTFVTLAVLFAAYLLAAGVMDIITGFGSIDSRRAWFLAVILGILELGIGIYLLRTPALAVVTLLFIIGGTLLLQGVVWVIAAVAHLDDPGLRFLAIAGGILAIVAGFYIIRHPAAGGLAFVWMLGAYGLLVGSFDIAAALSVKSLVRRARSVRARV